MGAEGHTSCVERFLRYVTIDTQSKEDSGTYPSTPGLDLLRLLVDELKALGLSDAAMDEHGCVMATIPATTRKAGVRGRHHHRLGHHPPGRGRQGRRRRDHGCRRIPDGPPRDPPMARSASASPPTRRSAPAPGISTWRGSERATPTPWTAAPGASG